MADKIGMDTDGPRFVPELGLPDRPSVFTRLRDRYKRSRGNSEYREVFGERIYEYEGQEFPDPTKVVIRNGIIVGETKLFEPVRSRRFVDPREIPGFAVGNCISLTDGDNKTVIVDQNGQADTVIRQYNQNTYWGEGAQEKAAAAARKIDAIYEVIREICPQFLLPTERFIYQTPQTSKGQEGWAVFERQQRAIFASPWLCEEPQIADKIEEDIKRLSNEYHKKIVAALINKNICQIDPSIGSIDNHEMDFGVEYDAHTRSLKEFDILDYVKLDT